MFVNYQATGGRGVGLQPSVLYKVGEHKGTHKYAFALTSEGWGVGLWLSSRVRLKRTHKMTHGVSLLGTKPVG